jgi:tetratricopeptide (TPR) repeat protein
LLAAELFNETGRPTLAEPLLRKAIALSARSPMDYEIIRAHYILGRILQRSGREEEAQRELALSEKLRAEFRDASGGTLKERSGPGLHSPQSEQNSKPISPEDRANAEQFLHEIAHPIAEAFNNLGAIAAGQHKCPDCVLYFKRAGEWEPSAEGLDRNLGRAAFLCEQYEDATAPLSRFLEQHQSDMTVRSALALSLFHLGKYQRVVEVLDPVRSSIQSDSELLRAYSTSQANLKR